MAPATIRAAGGSHGVSPCSSAVASALAAHGTKLRTSHFGHLRNLAWRARDFLVRLVDAGLPVALPTSPARMWWTAWFLGLVLYATVDVPLHIAFASWRMLAVVHLLSWITTVTFCFDIVLRFRTAYATTQGEIVRAPHLIALHYLRGMFLLDLVSALPLDEILDMTMGGQGHTNAYWIGLLRIPRLVFIMRQLNTVIPVKFSNLVSVAKLLGVMLLVTHWAACTWYYLSIDEIRENWPWMFTVDCRSTNDLDRYLFAFYRSFLILLGDRPKAYNNVERIFVLVLLFLGACLYAVIMGSMSLLVSNMWSMSSRHKQRAAMLQDALRYNGVEAGADLRSRVDCYFDFMATNEHPGVEGVSLLSELPTALHAELMSSVFEPLLTRIQLFAFCERAFTWRLSQRLRLCMFMPKDTIYDLGSVGHDMYLIRRGVVVLTEPDGCMTALLCQGDHFGELGVMSANAPRPQCAVAVCPTDVLMLSRGDLQDAMRDFPDSAALVRTRARVRLEDHEIGPAVWAASMAARQMQEADDELSDTWQPSPRRYLDKQEKVQPRSPAPRRGGGTSSDGVLPSSAISPRLSGEVRSCHGLEGAPARSSLPLRHLLGQVQGHAGAGRAAQGPVAEATEADADSAPQFPASVLPTADGTAIGSRASSPCRSPSSLSSEESFFEALGLEPSTAGPCEASARARFLRKSAPSGAAAAACCRGPATASAPRRKPPRIPAGRAGLALTRLVLEEEASGNPRRFPGPLPNHQPQREQGLANQRAPNSVTVEPGGSSKATMHPGPNASGGDATALHAGNGVASASGSNVPFWLASMRRNSPIGLPHRTLRQQLQQQPSSQLPTNLAGIDSRELAALERVRFSSQRPPDSGGVIRYLSRRARQEASATTLPAGPDGPAAQAAVGALGAAAAEDGSERGQVQEFSLDDLLEVIGSSGQHRAPTAPQLLFMPPQPFLGPDPLGPLFDQPPQAAFDGGSTLGLRWRGQSATQGGVVTSEGGHHPAPFSGAQDSTTRQLVGPVGRRSLRTALLGSGKRVSGTNCCKLASADNGSAGRPVDGWPSDQQQPCHHARCAQLGQQVAELRRQLAAAHTRLETVLENPLKEPSIQALMQRKLQAAADTLGARTEEVLQQLLERLLGVSARADDLSQQVSTAYARVQRLEDHTGVGFGAATAVGGRDSGGVLVGTPEPMGQNVMAPLAGLLRPPGAATSPMGALLPLSTAASGGCSRPVVGRQLSLKQSQMHNLRRSSVLGMKSLPWEEPPAETGAAGGGGVATEAAGSSLPAPDTALLAATINRAAGKNVRRRQSARDLSVLTSAIAAQQQQQGMREQHQMQQQHAMQQELQPETWSTTQLLTRTVSRELLRSSSRAVLVRSAKERSPSLLGTVFQPTASPPLPSESARQEEWGPRLDQPDAAGGGDEGRSRSHRRGCDPR